jgi:hypothetical protein
MELDRDERDLLVRIYQAGRRWADGGHDDRSFLLMLTGGMQRVLDHPDWDETWPTPTSSQIDDLEKFGLLRVEFHLPNIKNRTFELSTSGRRLARDTAKEAEVPRPRPPAPSSPLPTLDAVCRRLLDLEEANLITFANPMARLTGWSAAVRIGKGSDFRLTFAGMDRVDGRRATQTGPNFYIYGNVGQVAGRDITNHITITQEIVDVALEELNRRADLAETTREETRSLIERAKGHTIQVLVAAAGPTPEPSLSSSSDTARALSASRSKAVPHG